MANQNNDGAIIRFTVENIENLDEFYSETFYIRGIPWDFKVRKIARNQDGGNKDWLAIFSRTNSLAGEINKSIVAHFTIKLLTSRIDREPYKEDMQCAFFANRCSWGIDIISWENLVNPDNGYVVNNTCKFEAEIRTSPLYDVTDGEFMEVQNVQKCCDRSPKGSFRFIIKKFDVFPGAVSPKFILNDIAWQVFIHKYTHLTGTWLCADLWQVGYSSNWSCKINMHCKLIPFDANQQSVKKEFKNIIYDPKKTLMLSLIKWSEFIDTKKRLIENNSFVVEICFEISDVKGVELNAAKKRRLSNDFSLDATHIMSKMKIKMKCPICWENLLDLNTSITLCGHVFCTACIKHSIEQNEECPTCKKRTELADMHKMYFPEAELVPIDEE